MKGKFKTELARYKKLDKKIGVGLYLSNIALSTRVFKGTKVRTIKPKIRPIPVQ